MTIHLSEGQQLDDFRLDRRLANEHPHETWVATSTTTGDRVCLRIWTTEKSPSWSGVTDEIARFRGLVHPNINLATAGSVDGFNYLAEPWLREASPLQFDDNHTWQHLNHVIDAINYAHRLGLVHGNLHPENLLIDSNGQVHVTGFGTPASLVGGNRAFQSPQVQRAETPAADDDIYSLGCLLFRLLSGKTWETGVKTDLPVPPQLDQLLQRMLSESPLERQVDLEALSEAVRSHFAPSSAGIESISFSRSAPGSTATTTATTKSATAVPAATRTRRGVSTNLVIGGFVVVIALALLLFTLLPQLRSGTSAQATSNPVPADVQAGAVGSGTATAPPPAAPRQTPIEQARLEHLQQQGTEVASEIFRLQVSLEDQGVALWGAEQLEVLNATLAEAEAAFRESRFEAALNAYTQVRDGLNDMIAGIPAVLAEQLEVGQAALETGDAQVALTAYSIANAISPDDETISAGLTRAENLEQVQRLVRQAEAQERDGELDAALKTFSEARALDGLWQPAGDGVTRVNQAIRERRFRAAMSTGYQAVADRKFDRAREAFMEAADIMPSSNEPDEGLLQVDQAERNDVINVHRQVAEQHMAAERWEDAISEYRAALAITGNLAFAQEGLAEAEKRLELTQLLDKYIHDPALLQSDEGLQEARSLLRDLARANFPTVATSNRINLLARLISVARIEIPVTIVSDGNTNVVIRKHARLGQLSEQVVNLIPGRYVITGDRPGYRDVREELVLMAGQPAPTVMVSSSEKVR